MGKDWRDGIPDAKGWLNAKATPELSRARETDSPEIAALREEYQAIEEAKRLNNALPHPAPQGEIRHETDHEVEARLDARYAEIRKILAEHDGVKLQKDHQNER